MAKPHPALLEIAAGRSLPPVADAALLVKSAVEHRMAGLLLSSALPVLEAEPAALAKLKAEDARTRAWNDRLWAVLQSSCRDIAELGIEVGTFKGVTAEARWYARPGERPCRDVDLFLSPEDIGRAAEVVAALRPDLGADHRLERWIAGGVMSTTVIVDGIGVDLHYDPFKAGVPCRELADVWQRTRPFDLVGGGRVRVLDPETHLVLTLVHLHRDRFRLLLGFADVVRILHAGPLDWDHVARFLRNEGLVEPIELALEMVGATLGIEVPSLARVGGIRRRLWQAAWSPTLRLRGREERSRHRHRHVFLPLLGRGRLREALTHLRRTVVVPPRAHYESTFPDGEPYLLWLLHALPRRLRRRRSQAGATADAN